MDGFTLNQIKSKWSPRFRYLADVFNVKLHLAHTNMFDTTIELQRIIDNLVAKVKEDLDPENDRIAFRLEHPDLRAKSIDVNNTRPKNLTSERVLTVISKVLQSNEDILLDGRISLTITIVRGAAGSGLLKFEQAKGFYDFLKRKKEIVNIENTDRLCLPRAIVVGKGYVDYIVKKSITIQQFRTIKDSNGLRQNVLARELCRAVGLVPEEYSRGEKTFGLDKIKLFAQHLAPNNGLAIHNFLTANQKTFKHLTWNPEQPSQVPEGQWINILNLTDHFMPITAPSGFFCTHNYCTKCNKCYAHKTEHRCINFCQSCKTLDPDNCSFYLRQEKKTPCADCNREFFGPACLAYYKAKSDAAKHTVCEKHHCCKECHEEHNPQAKKPHRCGYEKCSACGVYGPRDHKCYMQKYQFPDEIQASLGNQAKAEKLYKERERKSRHVVWDLETFPLDQESGCDRAVPHMLVACTMCYKCIDTKFQRQSCGN
jgi:hypothetical protein